MEKRQSLTEQQKAISYYDTAIALNEVTIDPTGNQYVVTGSGLKELLAEGKFQPDVEKALTKVFYVVTEQIETKKRLTESGESNTSELPAFAPLIAPMIIQAYKTFQGKNIVAIQPITTNNGTIYGVAESYGGLKKTDTEGDSLLLGNNGGAILRLDSDITGNAVANQDLVEGDVFTLVGGTQAGKKISLVYGENSTVLVQLKDGMDYTVIPALVGSTFVKNGKTYTILVGETNSDVLFKMFFINYSGHRPVLEVEGSVGSENVRLLKIETVPVDVRTKMRMVESRVTLQAQTTMASAQNFDVVAHAMKRGANLLMNDVSQAIFSEIVRLALQNGEEVFDYNTTPGNSLDQKSSFLKGKINDALAFIQRDIRNLAPSSMTPFLICSPKGRTLVSAMNGFQTQTSEDGLFGMLDGIACYYNQDYNTNKNLRNEEGVFVGIKGDAFTSGLTYVPFIQLGFKQGTIVEALFTELLLTYSWDAIVEHVNGGKRFFRKIKIVNYV